MGASLLRFFIHVISDDREEAMPIYEYECPDCGIFDELRPLSQAKDPARCPECGAIRSRRISAPALTRLPHSLRTAMERNERSAHAPRSTRRCGCTGAHTCQPPSTTRGTQPVKQARKRNARPWMLGH